MYYQNYEDYMRAVLNYPIENRNTYEINSFYEMPRDVVNYQNTKELEETYPEIYKQINPIVVDSCVKCNLPITREVVDKLEEEIYKKVEQNSEFSVQIKIENRNNEKEIENRNNVARVNNVRTNVSSEQARKLQETENRQRRPQNPFLRDIIRILILNQLLGGNRPNRPPYPKPPIRPPFPGEQRPPIMHHRDYEDYLKF